MISIDTATNLHRYRQRYCRRIAMGKTQQEGENHNQCDGISTLIAPSAGFVSNIGRCRSSCEENSLRVEPSSIGGVSDDVKHTFSLLHSGFWRYQISPRQFYVFLSSILSILWKKWTGRSSRSRPLERCYCSCCHRRNLLKLPCTIACIVSAYSFYAMIFGTPSMSVLAAEKQDTSPLSNDGTVSPLDKHVIGDNKRSEQSSSNFFSFIDQNGDGILGTIELANFVQNYIGGTDFDTPEEVNSEVQSIIQNLDINKDVTLDKNDVYSYWMKLESLLTAEQVAEWVIYAVQLPEYVGRYERWTTGRTAKFCVDVTFSGCACCVCLLRRCLFKEIIRQSLFLLSPLRSLSLSLLLSQNFS